MSKMDYTQALEYSQIITDYLMTSNNMPRDIDTIFEISKLPNVLQHQVLEYFREFICIDLSAEDMPERLVSDVVRQLEDDLNVKAKFPSAGEADQTEKEAALVIFDIASIVLY